MRNATIGALWLGAITLATATLIVGAVCAVSRPYAQCQAKIEQTESQQAEYDYKHAILARIRCAGIAVNANNGAVTALATVVMAVFSVLLYQATQAASEISDDALRETKKAHEIASAAAAAAKVSAEAAVAAERAWVFLNGKIKTDLSPSHHEDFEISFVLRNCGRTPAIIRRFGTAICCVPHKKRPRLNRNSGLIFGTCVALEAGGECKAEGTEPELYVPHSNLSAEQMAAIREGDLRLFFIAVIEYEDVFGARHKTGLSFQYEPIWLQEFLWDASARNFHT